MKILRQGWMPRWFCSKILFWSNQPDGRASVVPEVAAVTVAVLACFEGGKQAFFQVLLRNTIKT